ncbi:hypothetical protein [Geobacillus sp. PK12]|uniref:hypothetical protein n=1 Tax=Geobacillus sp. PK12 TaxID=2508525 RepID=UPI0010102F5F|nr:hypothetical protein [Geobacillus sp. PK12]RXS89093.1 hypothetical protein ETR37_07710 [Geobacillus sp. PK12]
MHSEFELKVLSLIGALQNEIKTLKQEVASIKKQVQNKHFENSQENEKVTINEVREHIKKQLLLCNPNLRFTNGSRKTGRLTISDGNNTIDRILIRTSKSFREKEGYPSGWITIHEDLLNKYALYFFVVKDFDSKLHVLVMNQNNIKEWIQHKTKDSNGNYHFYINLIHGRWIDDREDHYDCSRFYDNWDEVTKLLSS